MVRFYTLIVALIFARCFQAQGQVLGVAYHLGNCAKCSLYLTALAPTKTNIPAYIVLPEDAKVDSSEIQESNEFYKEGFKLLFSDYYWNLLDKFPESSVGIIMPNQEVKGVQSLFSPNKDTIQKYSHLLKNGFGHIVRNAFATVHDGTLYEFNFNSNKVTAKKGDKETLLDIPESTKREFHEAMVRNFGARNVVSKFTTQPGARFKDKIIGFDRNPLTRKDNFIISGYADVPYGPNGKDTATNLFYGLINIADKLHPSVFFINSPPPALHLSYEGSYFIKVEDRLYLVVFPDRGEVLRVPNAKFIGEWKLTNGAYVFNKVLSIPIPDDYPDKDYTRLSFFDASYPYVLLEACQTLVNINSGVSTKLPILEGITAQRAGFFNDAIAYSKTLDLLYVVSVIDGKIYLQTFSSKTFQKIKTVLISEKVSRSITCVHECIDGEEMAFYCEDEKGNYRGYPLSLLLGDK